MKKSGVIIAAALILTIIIGGYLAFDSVFPKAAPIQTPTIDNIISISIIQNDNTSVEMGKDNFNQVLEYLEQALPTRKMSVNDYPSVRPYYMTVINTNEREYRYFVYIEDGYVHIEIPYEGIYKSEQQFYDLIE